MAGKKKIVGDAVDAAMRLIAGAEPQKTVKAYKLFKQEGGKLYPLFVGANEEVPMNQWVKATAGPQAASGKVKSKIGELAYRPGWHAGDLPIATHIGAKSHGDPSLPPDTRPSNQVWGEVEMANDVDWQKVANERARMTKKGTPDPKTAHITDQVPYGGYYRYKTNPNMTGEWLIGGDMRVNRVLTDDEVRTINEAAGVSDLPRREGYGGGGEIVEQALKLIMGGGDDAAKKAFANTRLKTPQGDPMRLYHMTPEDISEFRASSENRSGPAVFLSPYPDFQPAYHQSAERGPAGELTSQFKEGANVMPVYADVRNPLVLDHPKKIKEASAKYQGGDPNFPRIVTPEARAAMEADGYDGVVFGGDSPIPYGDRAMDARLGFQEARDEEFLVFDPKRVKSAVSNTGEYDFTNPDITKAEGGQVREGYAGKGRVVKNVVGSIVDAVTGRKPNRVFPELAERYPEVAPPVTAFDKKTGKEYLAKDLSPEALAVQKARDVIQKDIDAGSYDPFFDVRARADVDPSNYPSMGKTIDVKPVRPETQAKYRAMAFDPEGLSRLREGYTAGLEQKDVAENWYFMKQLEDKFVEELGPAEGRKQFKERFAKPMALTTGGADPTSNLLMSYYGNFLREKGLPIPEAAYDMPFPIGGRFASSNMGMFGRNMEKEITPDNPKRLNFQNNFLGYKEPTIDEQMSKGFDPKLQMPEWYGPYEEAINMLAREYDVDPRYFQEVTWAGLKSKGKGGYQGMPMIQHVNEAIERTSRLTGVPPEEVVRRGLVRGDMPIYGIAAPAGALAVGAMGEDGEEDIDNAVRIAKGGGGAFTKIVKSFFGPSEREGLEALTKAGSGYKGVPGKPSTVKLPGIGEVEAKPLPSLESAAEAYMKRLGRPGEHTIDAFPPLDEDFARRVAGAYGEMKHAPTDPEVKRTYDALAQETLDQLEAAKQAGIDFSFIRGEDPYKSSPGMGYADLAERGHLYVFPTEQGFGSDVAFDPVNNPLLKRIGPLGDLENATVNDAFRIVHDLYGHYGPGNPFFRAPGEERAFKLHSRMYSPEARPAMASETRGQNSWLNFGPYGSYNRGANAAETIYADQKTGIMPPWTYEKADGGAVDDALRIAKDVGGSTPVLMEDAKGNKYDAQGNIIPPQNPGPNPARSDATPQSVAAKAVNDPVTYDALMERYAVPDRDIAEYEALKTTVGEQPQDIRQMTHVGDRPRREVAVDMPLFGGEYSMGTAPYDVASGMQGAAQTAYDLKTAPFYFNPITAPIAAGMDLAEGIATNDPLTASLAVGFGPGGKYAKAAGIGAVNYFMDPAEAQAGPERWFSKLYRSAEALPMEKMTGEQALAMLRKTAPQEEIKWTGLEGFASENPVTTKKALLDFLKRNQVQTQDVVLGDLSQPLRYGPGTRYEQYNTLGGENYRETLVTLPSLPGNKVKEYQVSGPFPRTFASEAEAQKYIEQLEQVKAVVPGLEERLNNFPPSIYPVNEDPGFSSNHWDNIPNIVGHIRTQILDANLPGANRPMKLFNVDEAQSDWGKAGRDRGFKVPGARKKIADLEAQIRAANEKFSTAGAAAKKQFDDAYSPIAKAREAEEETLREALQRGEMKPREFEEASMAITEKYRPFTAPLFAERDRAFALLQQENAKTTSELYNQKTKLMDAEKGVSAAPYVTNTQNWTDLSIKKSLDQAIDSGADYFTFTPGEVQAARYDLSKHISKVQYNPDDGSLMAYDPKGKMVVNESVYDPSDLDEYVGRELGDKIRAEASSREAAIDDAYELSRDEENDGWVVSLYGEPSYDRNGDPLVFGSRGEAKDYINELKANDYGNNPVSLSGLDLRTGGEGMIDYYNNIYKKRVEKVVKDLTGKKVQWEVLPAETSEGIVPRLGFRIDDDLREAKFPTFASGGVVNKALQLTRDY